MFSVPSKILYVVCGGSVLALKRGLLFRQLLLYLLLKLEIDLTLHLYTYELYAHDAL